MSEPADPAPQASADELARVYLRGRDIDCPGCGYNRRDGAGASCPECGREIHVSTSEHAQGRALQVASLMFAIVLFSAGGLGVYIFIGTGWKILTDGIGAAFGSMTLPNYLLYLAYLIDVACIPFGIVMLNQRRGVKAERVDPSKLHTTFVWGGIMLSLTIIIPLVLQLFYYAWY